MRIYTIGFTQKSAERFFALLREHGVTRLVDIRLRPDGQLSGFAKSGDLAYFLRALADCDYQHLPELAPTGQILSDYRKGGDWNQYVASFEALMDQRRIPERLDRRAFTDQTCCLLCSEATPDQCHRRLVAERLAGAWGDIDIIHLG